MNMRSLVASIVALLLPSVYCGAAEPSSKTTSGNPVIEGWYADPEGYVEGPFMLKKDGKYYFMWSEGSWTEDDYCVAYAIADNPLGPFAPSLINN